MRNVLLFLVFLLLVSCTEKKEKTKVNTIENIDKDFGYSIFKTPKEYSPLSFIFEVSKKNRLGTLTMTNNFPENWVKKKDIAPLIQLINNTTKSDCYLNPLSSYVPFNDYAEIGGFARIFIQSYKDKSKLQLGLYSCPKVDKEINDNLLKWWEKIKTE